MSVADQKMFTDAVTELKSHFFQDWDNAIGPLIRLAMFDMLPALAAVGMGDRHIILDKVDGENFKRVRFAVRVVEEYEIWNHGLSLADENYGREYLGCTPLDPSEVEKTIKIYIDLAKAAIAKGDKVYVRASGNTQAASCCGAVGVAWSPLLVDKRREKAGNSLISNFAAAAHYMLARYHVCAALATEGQMQRVVEGYDIKKRYCISGGDFKLASMAIDPGNRPFPPDYAIRDWAYKGAADGERDRRMCNFAKDLPIIPKIDGKTYNEAAS